MKWEYHIEVGKLTDDRLNDLGAAGWELVTVLAEVGFFSQNIRAILKRAK